MKTSKRSVALILAGVVLLAGAGQWHARLIELRSDFQLQVVAPKDTTPLVVLTTVAFGGFRGLVADVLWVRASNLQEEGEYFELVQLSKWISQLEPKVPEVWSFQAWNLAYNISILFPDPEDRWRWVKHGIELLRTQGMTHNPTSASLHWDIGWMFQHKIGMLFDEAHPLYRQRLAAEMEEILQTGYLPEEDSDDLRERLKAEWVMDLSIMRDLNNAYGPIDWRLPEAHSLYWSYKGEAFATKPFDELSLFRMKYTSLRMMMMKGIVAGDPANAAPISIPRMDLIPILLEEMTLLFEGSSKTAWQRSYQAALYNALTLYAEYGRLEEAMEVYETLSPLEEQMIPGKDGFRQWIQFYLNQHPSELSPEVAMTRVVAAMTRSIELESVNPVRAVGFRTVARQTHRLFQQTRSGPDHMARTGLPPFDRIESALRDFLKKEESL